MKRILPSKYLRKQSLSSYQKEEIPEISCKRSCSKNCGTLIKGSKKSWRYQVPGRTSKRCPCPWHCPLLISQNQNGGKGGGGKVMPSDEGRFWQSELNKGWAIPALWISPCISHTPNKFQISASKSSSPFKSEKKSKQIRTGSNGAVLPAYSQRSLVSLQEFLSSLDHSQVFIIGLRP